MGNDAIQHVDEARIAILAGLKQNWESYRVEKILVIEDAFGRFTFGAWGKDQSREAIKTLLDSIKPFGSDSWFRAPEESDDFDPMGLDDS
jgi:hypothetical protein